MAKFEPKLRTDISVTFTLTEDEACALGALAGYDTEKFLEFFYEKLGRAYLEPHESGLRSLFQAVKCLDDKVKNYRRDINRKTL